MIRRMVMLVGVLGWALLVCGQGTTSSATAGAGGSLDMAKFLAPYMDSQTLAVAHADFSKVDTAAIEKVVTGVFDDLKVPADDQYRKELSLARVAADGFLVRF